MSRENETGLKDDKITAYRIFGWVPLAIFFIAAGTTAAIGILNTLQVVVYGAQGPPSISDCFAIDPCNSSSGGNTQSWCQVHKGWINYDSIRQKVHLHQIRHKTCLEQGRSHQKACSYPDSDCNTIANININTDSDTYANNNTNADTEGSHLLQYRRKH
ncbi:hypothetical protein FGO68_gene8424 [Halteria grandinella]|uniref:Uncharacterized protein n=1 Tax=Halteria grandinella TaxID=5974 RepID=A0A8J8N8U9_HALGN|nr:hypothetical protein FGO68_gene8424 [Halteria grandinella]